MFANMHLQHQNQDKLLFISIEAPYKFRTIDSEAPDDGLTPPRTLPFNVASTESILIISSFNGLVCVGIQSARYPNKYSDIILWNPLTGDYKTLSKTNSHNEYQINTKRPCLLYYYSIEDDYKLLCVTKSRYVYIYSLKSDSWGKIKSTENFHHLSYLVFNHWTPSASSNA